MPTPLNHRLLQQERIPSEDAGALLETALELRRAAALGAQPPLLSGRNIVLLCVDPHCAPAARFQAAAGALGARVTRIPADPALFGAEGGGIRMLARLYDAIECEHVSTEAAWRLQRLVGVPVFNGLARQDHALAALQPAMAPAGCDDPHYLIQALLVHTVA